MDSEPRASRPVSAKAKCLYTLLYQHCTGTSCAIPLRIGPRWRRRCSARRLAPVAHVLAAQRESASKRRSIIGRLPCYSHGAFNRRAGGLAIRQAMTAPLIGESQICASPSPVVLFQSINGEAKGLFRNSCRDDSMKGNPGQRLMEKTCASWCSCCWANFSQPPGQAQARPDFPSRLHSPQISLGSLRPALPAPVAPCPKPVVGPSNMTAAHMHPRFSA
jgi:hypothetical protein